MFNTLCSSVLPPIPVIQHPGNHLLWSDTQDLPSTETWFDFNSVGIRSSNLPSDNLETSHKLSVVLITQNYPVVWLPGLAKYSNVICYHTVKHTIQWSLVTTWRPSAQCLQGLRPAGPSRAASSPGAPNAPHRELDIVWRNQSLNLIWLALS